MSGTVQYECRRPRFSVIDNTEPRHRAPGLMRPPDIHDALAEAMWPHRAAVLRAAYAAHPQCFPRGVPVSPLLPTAAWVNTPLAYVVQRMGRVDRRHS